MSVREVESAALGLTCMRAAMSSKVTASRWPTARVSALSFEARRRLRTPNPSNAAKPAVRMPRIVVVATPGAPTTAGVNAATKVGIAKKTMPAPPAAVMTTPEAVSPHDERKRFFALASGAHCWACWATEVTAC